MKHPIRHRSRLVPMVLCAMLAAACGEEAEPARAPDEAAEPTQEAPEPSADPPEDTSLVTLSPGENRFDPPIQPTRVPDGAWYCDMGTVHYASPDRGEGTCPICNMQLVERGAAPEEHHHGDHH